MKSVKYLAGIRQKGFKYQFLIQYLAGLAYLIFGLFKYNNNDNDNFWESFIWIIGGVILIITGYFNHRVFSAYHIELTDSALYLKLSLKKRKKIHWDYISDIEIKPTQIIINTKNESSEIINLSNYNYQNVLSIKKSISEFASNKNISIK